MEAVAYDGGCLCGNVRYRATGTARDLCFCHCESCRRATGSVMVAWGTFDRDQFSVTLGRLSEYASSVEVVRGFCDRCGTSLTYRHQRRPDDIDVTLVTLDHPAVLAPACHIWVQDKLPWVRLDDGLPQFETVVDR